MLYYIGVLLFGVYIGQEYSLPPVKFFVHKAILYAQGKLKTIGEHPQQTKTNWWKFW
jgi:hypothetical protein